MWSLFEKGRIPDGDNAIVNRHSSNALAVASRIVLEIKCGGSITIDSHNIRTLKQRLTKMSPKRITQKLITDVIENYNTTYHRSIGMTPNEAKGKVMDADLSHNQVEADRNEKEFDVGLSVLYRLKKQAFDKESARWGKAVYKIVGIDRYRVQIRSSNGHTLYKAPNDLRMVKTETTDAVINHGDILEAEKILDHKTTRSGKYKYLIKWLGNEPDSWEPF
ncbi:unnamed protein product [Phytophthora lilii]|uniref:Unnamed protein product n=1 Tax=Phytophthora lilii TaxID=2077276 RepID=A0A9W6XDU5_9STRA|nr:unnamed protein product [Phytophthora lilii]